MVQERFSIVLDKITQDLLTSEKSVEEGLNHICELLKKHFDHYEWVGFYFAKFKTKTLHLKAFAGIPTDHIIIPFGKGICGQVAISNEDFIVSDVKSQKNYISCSIDVRSEIVIPLFFEGKNIGQIDVDSNQINSFTDKDAQLLKKICSLVSENYESSLLHL
jgi:GAF domain-containing protein